MNPVSKYIKKEDGVTAVEFSIVSIMFITLVMAIMEAGLMFMTWNSFQYSVQSATRYTMVNSSATTAEIRQEIADNMNSLTVNVDPATDLNNVNVTWPTGSNGVNFVQVEGSYDYTVLMPLLPDTWSNFTFTAKSRMPLQQ